MSATSTPHRKSPLNRASRLFKRDIWEPATLKDRTPRGRLFAFLRVCVTAWQCVGRNHIPSQAAALSYYSLIALGPMVALAIMVSGYVLKDRPNLAVESLNRLILFIAPPAAEFTAAEQRAVTPQEGQNQPAPSAQAPAPAQAPSPQAGDAQAAPGSQAAPAARTTGDAFNPQLVNLINHLVESASSGTVGVVGVLILAVICIRLVISIENTFNTIWGVRRGRSLVHRIVFYWAVLTFGALLGFAAGTLLSVSTLAKLFENLPFGLDFLHLGGWGPQILTSLVLALVLASFYRFIPNTTVRWRPAITGGLVVTLLVNANSYLSFLYIHQVLRQQSLYGSIGIVPVLMFGLYIFWLIILLGGQITYSVQNAGFLADERLWQTVSARERHAISLATFMLVARRFRECATPPGVAELSEQLRIAGYILNECISRLVDMGYLSSVVQTDEDGDRIMRFQPAKPLDQITLQQFHKDLETWGGASAGIDNLHIDRADPIVGLYLGVLDRFHDQPEASLPLSNLLEAHPVPRLQPKLTQSETEDPARTT